MKNINAQSTSSTFERSSLLTLPIVKSHSTPDLKQVFINELIDIYITQKALVKTFSKLADKANSEHLADCIYDHLCETEDHTKRLEKLFSILGVKSTDEIKKNESAFKLLRDKEALIEKTKNGILRDTVIISACSKIKTYEIACFGSLVAFAKTLAENEIALLLNDILNEKKYADETLVEIKEYIINNEPIHEYAAKWQQE